MSAEEREARSIGIPQVTVRADLRAECRSVTAGDGPTARLAIGAEPSRSSRFVIFVSLRDSAIQTPSPQDPAAALVNDLPAGRAEVVEEGLFDEEVFGHGQGSGARNQDVITHRGWQRAVVCR